MEKNDQFNEGEPPSKLLVVSRGNNQTNNFNQPELARLVEKKKRVFLSLILVLILFVVLNVAYFLYSPNAFATIFMSILLVNLALLIYLYYVMKKENTMRGRSFMAVIKDESPRSHYSKKNKTFYSICCSSSN